MDEQNIAKEAKNKKLQPESVSNIRYQPEFTYIGSNQTPETGLTFLSEMSLTPKIENYQMVIFTAGSAHKIRDDAMRTQGIRRKICELFVKRGSLPYTISLPDNEHGYQLQIRQGKKIVLKGTIKPEGTKGMSSLRSIEGIKKAELSYSIRHDSSPEKAEFENEFISASMHRSPTDSIFEQIDQEEESKQTINHDKVSIISRDESSTALRRKKKQKMLMKRIKQQLLLQSIHQKEEATISARDSHPSQSINEFLPPVQHRDQTSHSTSFTKQTIEHALEYRKPVNVRREGSQKHQIDFEALGKTQSQLGIDVDIKKIISLGLSKKEPDNKEETNSFRPEVQENIETNQSARKPGFITGRDLQSEPSTFIEPFQPPQIIEIKDLETRSFIPSRRNMTEGCQTEPQAQSKPLGIQTDRVAEPKPRSLNYTGQVYSVKVERKIRSQKKDKSVGTSISRVIRQTPDSGRRFDFIVSNLSVNLKKKLFGRKRLTLCLDELEYYTEKLHGSHLLWVGKEFMFSRVSFEADLTLSLRCEVEEAEMQLCRVKVPITQLILNYRQCYYQTRLKSPVTPSEELGVLIVGYETFNQGESDRYRTPEPASSWQKSSGVTNSSRSKSTYRRKIPTQSIQTRRMSEVETYLKEQSLMPTPKISPIRMKKYQGGCNIHFGRASRFRREKTVHEIGPGQYKIHSPFSRYGVREQQ